jgi:hypothetical protein
MTITVPLDPDGGVPDGGDQCQAACSNASVSSIWLLTGWNASEGGATCQCRFSQCVFGRYPIRPSPIVEAAPCVDSWLAGAAHVEASSARAFGRLALELAAHGAPADLVEQARRAVYDELRHTRILSTLAGAVGGSPVLADRETVRSLEEIAVENAVEGGMVERAGAALLLWQSREARSSELRAAFAAIAVDEARHVSLAAAVHEWLRFRLDVGSRERVAAAQREGVSLLIANLCRPIPRAWARLGLPSPSATTAILERMFGGHS